MLALVIAACAGKPERHSYVADYQQAVAEAGIPSLDPDTLPPAARRFYDFLDGFSADTVARRTTDVYAEDAFLNDTLKTVRGSERIRDYFVETFERVDAIEATITEAAGGGNSWFFRWRMTVTFEDLNKGLPIESIGVSHIVFDAQGRVVVHQDYWDSGTHFFTLVPVAGKIIDRVKDKL